MNRAETEVLLNTLRNDIKQREISILKWSEENKNIKDKKDKIKLNLMAKIVSETDEFTGKPKFSNAEKREIELNRLLDEHQEHIALETQFQSNDKSVKETYIELQDNKFLFKQYEIISRLAE